MQALFYLKRTEVKTDGTCPIMGRINIGRTVAQFSTKLNVLVSLWDTRANRASGKSTKAVEINRALDTINISVHSHYQRLTGLQGNVTATEIKNAFQGIASAQETIVDYFARHNREFAKRVGINREKTTAEQYEISRNHLVRFIRKKYNVSDIPFSKLDFSFIEAFDFYLKVELKRMPNTILGIVRHVRKMIKLAIGEGIISRNPFEGYEPERPKAQQKYLTREELNRIMTTQLDHPSRYLTRDMFLFSVFTGLAFRDICNLTPKHIVKADDGILWIKTTRQKTGTPCDIPLLDIPLKIIEKYKGLAKDRKLLPMLSCGRLNKNLKVIGKLCNIERRIIYHCGRHTYATEICLSQGVPIESVSRMLGHRDLRSTQIYAKITNHKIAEDVKRVESRIESRFQIVE
ncbi:tyrosine recombinase [Betaproteobacteria bacterium]|nr:tyrosine recombinase [Betaproteobacteria bacterium]